MICLKKIWPKSAQSSKRETDHLKIIIRTSKSNGVFSESGRREKSNGKSFLFEGFYCGLKCKITVRVNVTDVCRYFVLFFVCLVDRIILYPLFFPFETSEEFINKVTVQLLCQNIISFKWF